MRLVYIDEAGTGNPNYEPYVTVAGIIVHGDHQLGELQKRLAKVLKKHIPEKDRAGFVFHAAHIFNGGGPLFDRHNPDWPLDRRLAIADDLAAIPKDLRLWIAFGWHQRSEFFKSRPDLLENLSNHQKTIGCLTVSFLGCLALAEKWMHKHAKNENCIVIMEDNPPARATILEAQNFNQDPRNAVNLDPKAARLFPLKRIREDVLFQPKKQSNPLELADFCAYVWKRFLMNQNDERYLRFFDPMRSQIATF